MDHEQLMDKADIVKLITGTLLAIAAYNGGSSQAEYSAEDWCGKALSAQAIYFNKLTNQGE